MRFDAAEVSFVSGVAGGLGFGESGIPIPSLELWAAQHEVSAPAPEAQPEAMLRVAEAIASAKVAATEVQQ